MKTLIVAVKGGPGSGNWGHAGRPGLVGGSGGAGGVTYGGRRYGATGRSESFWLGPKGDNPKEDIQGVRVYYNTSVFDHDGGYSVDRTRGTYADPDFIASGRDLKSVGTGEDFRTVATAQAYLKDEFGIDWDGTLRPSDSPVAPADSVGSMAKLQVSQAVQRGELSPEQASQRLGIR